jgi:hypothetical protein
MYQASWWAAATLTDRACDITGGKPAVDVTSGGWVHTPENPMKIKPVLEAECVTKPDSLIVIYAMDNSCVMYVSPSSAGLPDGIIAFQN